MASVGVLTRPIPIGQLVDDAMAGIERDNPALKGVLPKDYARPVLPEISRLWPAAVSGGWLRKDRVKPILDMAISRFNAFAKLKKELETAKAQLDDRKAIDRAKTQVMRAKSIPEEQAYALMRHVAMNENKKFSRWRDLPVMCALAHRLRGQTES
jgi:hypothetical protein